MMEWDEHRSDAARLRDMAWHLGDLSKLIKDNSIGIEIGVWKAWSTRIWLEHTKCKFIYACDAWSTSVYKETEGTESPEYENYEKYKTRYNRMVKTGKDEDFEKHYDEVYFQVMQKLIPYSERIQIYRMSSKRFWNIWIESGKSPVDWAYIDGSHSYEPCLYDLESARKAVKKGGIIMGDDYNNYKSGVVKAVDEFCNKYGYERKRVNSEWRWYIQL